MGVSLHQVISCQAPGCIALERACMPQRMPQKPHASSQHPCFGMQGDII